MTTSPRRAVQLGNAESIFPHLLASAWRRRGLDSVIVSATAPRRLPPEASLSTIVDASLDRSRAGEWLKATVKRLVQPLYAASAKRASSAFRERTGFSAPQPWETMLLPHVVNGWRVARAAQRLQPLFVFGHEVTSYGLATAWVPGVPRILFPWGADVMSTAEVSTCHFRLARYALRAADLVVPSSAAGARHIQRRFGLPADKVQAISWGADLDQFRRATPAERAATCSQLGVDPARRIVLNARRFLPLYNCDTVVRAFLRVADRRLDSHFVLLGGRDTDQYVLPALEQVRAQGHAGRFTFLRDNVSLETCAAIMAASDVFLSLCDRVDMRSKSVLEASAAGAVPVLGDDEEYRSMEADGFEAVFVKPRDDETIAAALDGLLDAPDRCDRMRRANDQYLALHENSDTQMDRLLDRVLEVVARHARP